MRHTFWSCLIRCANMKWIQRVSLKIQSRHDSVHRRTDGRTDGQGETSIPPFQLHWSEGYKNRFSSGTLHPISGNANDLVSCCWQTTTWTTLMEYAYYHYQVIMNYGNTFQILVIKNFILKSGPIIKWSTMLWYFIQQDYDNDFTKDLVTCAQGELWDVYC